MNNYKTTLLVSLCIGAYSQSFAADPPAASPAPAEATAAVAATPATATTAATPAAAPAATAPASDKTSEDAALLAQTRRLRTAGYKPRVKNGNTIWCKPEIALGSRLAQVERCGTPEEIERSVQDAKDTVEKMQTIQTQHQSN